MPIIKAKRATHLLVNERQAIHYNKRLMIVCTGWWPLPSSCHFPHYTSLLHHDSMRFLRIWTDRPIKATHSLFIVKHISPSFLSAELWLSPFVLEISCNQCNAFLGYIWFQIKLQFSRLYLKITWYIMISFQIIE